MDPVGKAYLLIVIVGLLWLLRDFERESRGPGSWDFDRVVLRAQGALLCSGLYVILS